MVQSATLQEWFAGGLKCAPEPVAAAKLGVGLDALEVVAGVAGVAQRLQPPEEELGVRVRSS